MIFAVHPRGFHKWFTHVKTIPVITIPRIYSHTHSPTHLPIPPSLFIPFISTHLHTFMEKKEESKQSVKGNDAIPVRNLLFPSWSRNPPCA